MTKRIVLLGGLSLVLLACQVTLTRLFSVVFWYHFGFLILSTALLGFGLAGLVILALKKHLKRWDPDRTLIIAVSASGVLLTLALLVVTHVRFNPMLIHRNGGEVLKVAVSVIALAPAFVVLGGSVLFMLQRWSRDVGRMYAANLIGSGVGCLAAIVVLNAFGGLVAYLLFAAALPLLAAWYGAASNRRAALGSLVVAVLLLAPLPFAEQIFPITTVEGKQFTCRDPNSIVFSDWNAISKLDICHDEKLHSSGYGLWGLSRRNASPLPQRLGAIIDRWAYTTIIEHRDDAGYYNFLNSMPIYLAYRWTHEPRVLIIGSGGGMDIRAALLHGAREVHAVEINPALFRAMHKEFAEYSGDVYMHPKVRGHLGEGRSYVESSDRRYDLIQLSGVDTLSATQAGAFALSESFLYTREAVRGYLEKLEDRGVLTLTRWFLPDRANRARHSLRLFILAVEALTDMSVPDPGRHIVFLRSGMFTVILVKRAPITPAELTALEQRMADKGYSYLYNPLRRPESYSSFYDYLETPDREDWLADYPYNVAAPSDDAPFFFELRRVREIFQRPSFHTQTGVDGLTILAVLFLEMLVACIAMLALSYRLQRGAPRPAGWLYFISIGLGFMLIEVTLSQRLVLFLGHPIYALSVVLFSILVFSGLGAMLSDRLRRVLPVPTMLFALAALMLLWALFGTATLRAMIGWPVALRMSIAVFLIAIPAVLMGTAFPEAIRRLTQAGETELGIYWAWNGVGSVLASVLAVIIAMATGFSWVMVVAAACYVVAGSVLRFLGSPAPDQSGSLA
jgi:spermidine synthase